MDTEEKQGASLKKEKENKSKKNHHFGWTIQALSKDPACHTCGTACSPMLFSANSHPLAVCLCSGTLALSLCKSLSSLPRTQPSFLPSVTSQGYVLLLHKLLPNSDRSHQQPEFCSSCFHLLELRLYLSTQLIVLPQLQRLWKDLSSAPFCSYQEKLSVL